MPPPPPGGDALPPPGSAAGLGGNIDAGKGVAGRAKEPVSHDWDAIFAGLDASPNPNATAGGGADDAFAVNSSPKGKDTVNGTTTAVPSAGKVEGLGLAKTNTESSAEDDPILKRLMGMGFRRADSLKALERYDYNIDKVGAPCQS